MEVTADAATVVIYCNAASHCCTPIGPVVYGPDADARLRQSDAMVLGVFRRSDGNGWALVPSSARRGGHASRTRYRAVEAGDLRCSECNDAVRVNHGRFHEDLDDIAAQGISAISVGGLRAARARRA